MSLVVRLGLMLVMPLTLHAAELHGVQLPDTIDIGGQKLVLNGSGFGDSKKHGATFVAGLYLQAKNKDAQNIISNPQAKILRLTFLRAMDKKEVQHLWTRNFERSCQKECEKAKTSLNTFNDLMIAVAARQTVQLNFDEDGVTLKFEGADPHQGHVFNKTFQRILLSSFLVTAKTDALRDGLLGLLEH